jgi:hypothetical protein
VDRGRAGVASDADAIADAERRTPNAERRTPIEMLTNRERDGIEAHQRR